MLINVWNLSRIEINKRSFLSIAVLTFPIYNLSHSFRCCCDFHILIRLRLAFLHELSSFPFSFHVFSDLSFSKAETTKAVYK